MVSCGNFHEDEFYKNSRLNLLAHRQRMKSKVFMILTFTSDYSEIEGNNALVTGAGWIIDHKFVLGLHGYGFVNNLNHDEGTPGDEKYSLAGGYGGFYFEPIVGADFPIHLTFPMQLGVGGISATKGCNRDEPSHDNFFCGRFFQVLKKILFDELSRNSVNLILKNKNELMEFWLQNVISTDITIKTY